MARIRQGEIWWANLPAPARRRPVLILTRSDAIARLFNVTVAPLTRTIRNINAEVVLSLAHGVPSVCAISLDNILTVPKTMLDQRIVKLPEETMKEAFGAIRFIFAMP